MKKTKGKYISFVEFFRLEQIRALKISYMGRRKVHIFLLNKRLMQIYIMHTIYEVLKDDYIQTMVLDFPLISFGGVYTYIDYT